MTETSKAVATAPQKRDIVVARGGGGLILKSLGEMHRFGEYVVAAGIAPKGMESAASILLAVQLGYEIGLAPMAAVQSVCVINGRPAVYGDAAKGLVEASGLCTDFVESFTGTFEEDAFTAVCTVMRKGRPKPVTASFSIGDAKRANLWTKKGPWQEYPKRMLQMRARGFCIRDAFPDVLKGIHLYEEMIGGEPLSAQMGEVIDVSSGGTETLDSLTAGLKEKQAAREEPTSKPAADTDPATPHWAFCDNCGITIEGTPADDQTWLCADCNDSKPVPCTECGQNPCDFDRGDGLCAKCGEYSDALKEDKTPPPPESKPTAPGQQRMF